MIDEFRLVFDSADNYCFQVDSGNIELKEAMLIFGEEFNAMLYNGKMHSLTITRDGSTDTFSITDDIEGSPEFIPFKDSD